MQTIEDRYLQIYLTQTLIQKRKTVIQTVGHYNLVKIIVINSNSTNNFVWRIREEFRQANHQNIPHIESGDHGRTINLKTKVNKQTYIRTKLICYYIITHQHRDRLLSLHQQHFKILVYQHPQDISDRLDSSQLELKYRQSQRFNYREELEARSSEKKDKRKW